MNEKQSWSDKLMNAISKAGTAILMNLMFLVASLPIVTIGPAWCGLMSSIRYNIRGDGWFDGFKKGYCTRFWRSLISWCIWAPICVLCLYDFGNAIAYAVEMNGAADSIVGCVISGLFFLMASMVCVSMLVLNVYIPTSVSEWIKNSVNFFRRPVELIVAAALFWAPLLLAWFYGALFLHLIMVLVAIYFALAAVCGTMTLKGPLVEFLLEARANGTLLAEEGAVKVSEEE